MTEQIVQPAEPRHSSIVVDGRLSVNIPSPKKWFLIAFVGIWLMFWLLFEIAGISFFLIMYIAVVANPETNVSPFWAGNLFIMLWLSFATIIGVYAIFVFLWQIRGREVVQVNESTISLRKEIFSAIGRTKTYSKEHLKSLRISPYNPGTFGWGRNLGRYGLVGGFLAFDYGAKTIHFGAGVDEAEAKQIYQEIIEHYPDYGKAIS